MKKMKRLLAVLLSFCCFVLTGCLDKVFYNGYTEEEVGIINAKFDSFQNSKNFAIEDSDTIALIDKSVTIGTDKLYCNGKKINEKINEIKRRTCTLRQVRYLFMPGIIAGRPP